MLSNWLSKGTQIINNSAKSLTQASPNMQASAMTKQILSKIEARISKELGENVQGSLGSINADVVKQTQLEKNILDIKEKYNNLVAQSEAQSECLKQMMHSFVELLRNIGTFLENEDMLTPLKDLQPAFYSCNTGKVQKQLKYFSKLYDAALQDYLKARLGKKQDQKKDEVSLFKNLNKNLEVELFRSRNNCVDLEKRLNQLHSKNQQLTDKLSILEKLGAQSALLASQKQKEKFMEKQNEMTERIKVLEREKIKLQRLNRELENEVVKVNSAIQVLKVNQENIIQEMKKQISHKELTYEGLISKVRHEKIQLQNKVKTLNEQIETISQQVSQLKRKQTFSRRDSQSSDIKQLNQKLKDLQEQINKQKTEMNSLISKDIMKSLFTSFDDESKDWSTRKGIKNQIHLLLDIKEKKVGQQEKKWFGIF